MMSTAFCQNKLQSRSISCVFIGYAAQHSGYLCLDASTNHVYTSRHVIFNELVYPFASSVMFSPITQTLESHILVPSTIPLESTASSTSSILPKSSSCPTGSIPTSICLAPEPPPNIVYASLSQLVVSSLPPVNYHPMILCSHLTSLVFLNDQVMISTYIASCIVVLCSLNNSRKHYIRHSVYCCLLV